MSWARAAYRSRQFFGALRPRLTAADRELVAGRLSPALARLFSTMTLRDQRHAVDVARLLLSEGESDPPVVEAALLHDVGKGHVRTWHRVAFVIGQALVPGTLARLAPEGVGGWRAPFDRLLRHGEIGARMLEKAGAGQETVRLVRYHEGDVAGEERLSRLRAADDRC